MEYIIGKRQSGKTTKMLEWLLEDSNRVLITFSYQEVDRLKRLLADIKSANLIDEDLYARAINNIYSWQDWVDAQHRTNRRTEVGIDNADYILRDMLGSSRNITKMSLNK